MIRNPLRIALIVAGMILCLSALASVSRADCPCSSVCGCGCQEGGSCSCSTAAHVCGKGGLKKDRFVVRLIRAPRALVVHAALRHRARVERRHVRRAHGHGLFGWNPRFRPQRWR